MLRLQGQVAENVQRVGRGEEAAGIVQREGYV